MTAAEWGAFGPADQGVAGDAVLADGYARSFVTASPAGFPVVVTVSAVPAYVSPGTLDDDPNAPRDVLEVTTVDTYLHGADLADGDPFDSETEYAWPIDYWPVGSRDPDTDQPTLEALDGTAAARIRDLPQAWIDGMLPPPAGLLLHGEPFPS